ncbi:cytochrome C oxidase subunit I [Kitasatospora sp. NBC_01560]|uniref:cytochrome C oxidase subunit I n=1 Tax=Kitasatospora sp. NBC_01560 TaxID=2975965 RepID=UPI00386A80B7
MDARAEIARLEGYLAWEAEVSAAERDARAFAGQFRWLSPAERDDLERAYAADRLRYAEDVVDRAVERCRQLAARYRSECRRICARWAAVCLSVTLAAALLAVVPAALRS